MNKRSLFNEYTNLLNIYDNVQTYIQHTENDETKNLLIKQIKLMIELIDSLYIRIYNETTNNYKLMNYLISYKKLYEVKTKLSYCRYASINIINELDKLKDIIEDMLGDEENEKK